MLGSVVLAQSKKEQYQRLLNEITLNQHKYDSTRQAYWVQHGVLGTTVGATDRKIRELEKSEMKIKDLSMSILKKTNIFDDLGVDYSTILDRKIARTSAVSGDLMKRLRAINLYQKDFPNLDTLHLKDLKIAKKNEMMAKHLVVLNDNTKACSDQIQVQMSKMDSVQKINQEVEAKLNLNTDLTEKFRLIDEQLSGKLKELEIAYLSKGPKGFNENYKKYFPLVKDKVEEPFEFVPAPSNPYPKVKRTEPIVEAKPELIQTVADVSAEFPGGISAMLAYLSEHMVIPDKVKEQGITGKCYIKFIVLESGEISDVKVIRGVQNCPECDAEALRVVENMPNWIPAKSNDKVVKSYFNLPISFKPQ